MVTASKAFNSVTSGVQFRTSESEKPEISVAVVAVCPMSDTGGPIRYVRTLLEWSDRHPGLENFTAIDKKLRWEFYRAQRENPRTVRSLTAAINMVLKDKMNLFSEAVTEVTSAKMAALVARGAGAEVRAPGTPPPKPKGGLVDPTPPKKRVRPGKKQRAVLKKLNDSDDSAAGSAIAGRLTGRPVHVCQGSTYYSPRRCRSHTCTGLVPSP